MALHPHQLCDGRHVPEKCYKVSTQEKLPYIATVERGDTAHESEKFLYKGVEERIHVLWRFRTRNNPKA